jgi:hypothetical protein
MAECSKQFQEGPIFMASTEQFRSGFTNATAVNMTIQKRASGRSIHNLVEADFWTVSLRVHPAHEFRVARDPGVVWRIHYEPQADLRIPIDCAGGPGALVEAHYP